jgi:hypothetical protein
MTIAEAVRVVVDESARKDERIAHLEREVARLESWICDMQIQEWADRAARKQGR